jgi:hypothetical protein
VSTVLRHNKPLVPIGNGEAALLAPQRRWSAQMTMQMFRWLMLVPLLAFMPMYIFVGIVPVGSLLIEATAAAWMSVQMGQRFLWGYLILSAISVGLCVAIAWACARLVYWFHGRSRDLIGAAVLLAPLALGALPIYGVSVHGPAILENAFDVYARYLTRGSL